MADTAQEHWICLKDSRLQQYESNYTRVNLADPMDIILVTRVYYEFSFLSDSYTPF